MMQCVAVRPDGRRCNNGAIALVSATCQHGHTITDQPVCLNDATDLEGPQKYGGCGACASSADPHNCRLTQTASVILDRTA
jgi:hypothetical protein